MNWSLFEPCCGTAALTLHLLGVKRSLMPYQGSKWRYRRELEAVVRAMGFEGAPFHVYLNDVSPWSQALFALTRSEFRRLVIRELEFYEGLDPRVVYDTLIRGFTPLDVTEFTAQFLFLQRLAYSGKAVGLKGRKWKSPGFNKTSAYGTAATEKFGAVSPMIPSLIQNLREFPHLDAQFHISGSDARLPIEPTNFDSTTLLIYFDPPYHGSTHYPGGNLSRGDVYMLGRRWAKQGFKVIISESEPLAELVEEGWKTRRLQNKRSDTSPFKGKQEEWVTYT